MKFTGACPARYAMLIKMKRPNFGFMSVSTENIPYLSYDFINLLWSHQKTPPLMWFQTSSIFLTAINLSWCRKSVNFVGHIACLTLKLSFQLLQLVQSLNLVNHASKCFLDLRFVWTWKTTVSQWHLKVLNLVTKSPKVNYRTWAKAWE